MSDRVAPSKGAITKEDVMRKILRKRGYIVTLQPGFVVPFPVGHVLNQLGGEGLNIGNFIVTAKTSQRDFFQQCLLSKRIAPHLWTFGSPTQHLQICKKQAHGKIVYWRLKPTRKKRAESLLTELEGKL